MLLHELVDAARVLQRLIRKGESIGTDLVVPARLVVVPLLGVIAGEQAVLEAELILHQERRVGVVEDVLVLNLVVRKQIVDHPAEPGDIGAGADRHVEVGHRRGASEPGIDDDQLGVVMVLRLGDPLEAAGMCFSGVAAHDDDQVGVLDVCPRVRHRATAECWGQTGHRWTVSNSSLIIEGDHPQRAHDLVSQEGSLVGGRGCG